MYPFTLFFIFVWEPPQTRPVRMIRLYHVVPAMTLTVTAVVAIATTAYSFFYLFYVHLNHNFAPSKKIIWGGTHQCEPLYFVPVHRHSMFNVPRVRGRWLNYLKRRTLQKSPPLRILPLLCNHSRGSTLHIKGSIPYIPLSLVNAR